YTDRNQPRSVIAASPPRFISHTKRRGRSLLPCASIITSWCYSAPSARPVVGYGSRCKRSASRPYKIRTETSGGGSGFSPSGEPRYRPHEAEQVKRLRKIQVEALTEGAVEVIAGVMRRHGDRWHAAAALCSKLPDLLHEPKAILPRHHQVRHQDVHWRRLEDGQRVLCRARLEHLRAERFERGGKNVQRIFVVVHDKNLDVTQESARRCELLVWRDFEKEPIRRDRIHGDRIPRLWRVMEMGKDFPTGTLRASGCRGDDDEML